MSGAEGGATARTATTARAARTAWVAVAAAELALGVLLAGCGGTYRNTYDRWTRHDYALEGVDTSIDASATLKTLAWREAYVAEKASRAQLSATQRDALLATGVDVAGVAQRHLGVRRVQRAHVHVRQAAPAAHEHLEQRPLPTVHATSTSFLRARFSA